MADRTIVDTPKAYAPDSALVDKPLGTNQPNQSTFPKLLVFVDDKEIPGVAYVNAHISGFNLASNVTVFCSYSIMANTNIGAQADPNSVFAWLIEPQPIRGFKRPIVKIYAGYVDSVEISPSTENLEEIFRGVLDRLEFDANENSVTLSCRDFSAVLQEAYTHEQFRNQTTSEIVREIIAAAGLEVGEIVETGQAAGTVYDYEKIHFESIGTQGLNLWEVILKFSHADGFKAFFWQGKFYYIPFENFKETIRFTVAENIEKLRGVKNYSIANARISVEVASSDVLSKKAVLAQVGPAAAGGAKGDRASIRIVEPGLDAESAQIWAEAIALFYAQFEYQVEISCTGSVKQNPLNNMMVTETGTQFSRMYRIITVQWTIGIDSGWAATVTGLALPDDFTVQTHRAKQGAKLGRLPR